MINLTHRPPGATHGDLDSGVFYDANRALTHDGWNWKKGIPKNTGRLLYVSLDKVSPAGATHFEHQTGSFWQVTRKGSAIQSVLRYRKQQDEWVFDHPQGKLYSLWGGTDYHPGDLTPAEINAHYGAVNS